MAGEDLIFNILAKDRNAKRTFKELQDEVNKLHRALKRLDGTSADAGKSGSSFGKAFSAAMKLSLDDPKVTAVVVGLAANAAPAIAMALNVGILAGLGGGVIAAGLATAAKDPRVTKAGSDLSTNFLSTMTSATEPFVEPMIRGLKRLQSTVTDIGPDLHDVFAGLAPSVDKLFAGVDGLVRKALPGLKKGLEGAAPVIDAIAAGLPAIGQSIGVFFGAMAADSKRMAGDMKILMAGTSGAIFATAVAVKFLSTVFNDSVVRGLQLVKVVGAIGQFFSSAIPGGQEFFAGVSKWAKGALDSYTGKQKEAGDGAETAKGQFDGLATSLFGVGDGFSAAWKGASGDALGYEKSIIAVKDAIRAVGKSFDENGASLNANTDAGARNRTEVLNAIDAARAHADEVYNMNRAVMGNDAALVHSGEAFDKYSTEIYNNAAAHGADKGQLEELKRVIDNLKPKTVDIHINTIRTEITRQMVAGSNGVSLTAREYYGYRMGGITPVHARKGLLSSASMFSGGPPLYAFAEHGTGQEAFIPKNGNTGRSRNLAKRVVDDWLGGPEAIWGGRGGGGNAYPITVNISAPPGADAAQIAQLVPAAVIGAIKTYEQSNGSGWRS